MISIENKIEICATLGSQILTDLKSNKLEEFIAKAKAENPWFTNDSIVQALTAICQNYLDKDALVDWVTHYALKNQNIQKNVGLVMAGNIPAVGFHDLLSVFICNHKALVKYSSKDGIIVPYLVERMVSIERAISSYISRVERLKDFDAVIATGGNNTSRYFEYYFRDVPHIIRKNRSAVALLTGDESEEELLLLGKDIFSYFGLGCRNVSKLYLPKGYNLEILLELLHTFNEVVMHHKYKNNFDYNIALYLLNKEHYLNNGSIILKEDRQISSRIATVHYEYYEDINEVIFELTERRGEIQCVVSGKERKGIETIRFGQSQFPSLMDYADGVDTIQFLLSI